MAEILNKSKGHLWEIETAVCGALIIGIINFGLDVYRNDTLQDAEIKSLKEQLAKYDNVEVSISKITGDVEYIKTSLAKEVEDRKQDRIDNRDIWKGLKQGQDDIRKHLLQKK